MSKTQVKSIFFVSDFFVNKVAGGAELTSEAIIENSILPIHKIESSALSVDFIKSNKDKYWIFGNFSLVSKELLLYATQHLNYSVIEYDYKYCKYRSPQKHVFYEDNCNCEEARDGKMVSIFLAKAKSLWYMSKEQKNFYEEKFPFFRKQKSFVLSSVFNRETLQYIKDLDTNKKSDEWLIINSSSWIKGVNVAREYASSNKIKTKTIHNLPYKKLLGEMAQAKGLIFLPPGMDTCPRVVIEAKLLGCELAINENVQHKEEEWFATNQKIYDYLKSQPSFFWNEIEREVSNG